MTTSTQEFTVPQAIKFNDDELTADQKQPKAPEGTYRWVCKDAELSVIRYGFAKGSYSFRLRWVPLRDPMDPSTGNNSFQVYEDLVIPKKNPEVPDHDPGKEATFNMNRKLRAMGFNLPGYPRKNPDTELQEVDGVEVDGRAARALAEKTTKQEISRLSENLHDFLDRTMYATVSYSDKGYAKLKGHSAEAPAQTAILNAPR